MTAPASTSPSTRVRKRFWIGLVAVVIYVALAGGLANVLESWLQPGDAVASFALTHFPVLIPLIIAGLIFVRWSGWGDDVWRTPASFETRPRRWWMLAFPLLLVAQSVTMLVTTPWSDRTVVLIVVVALGTLLVGFGEELYFRGILRTSLRAHHGETLTLIVTSLLFGAAHSLASVYLGLEPGFIAFQVAATGLNGLLFYGVFRATGSLWLTALLHGLNDFALYVANGDVSDHTASNVAPPPITAAFQIALWVLAVVLLISSIRQDVRERREGRPQP